MNSKLVSKLDVVAFDCSHADVAALWHTAPSSHDRAGPARAGSAPHRDGCAASEPEEVPEGIPWDLHSA